MGKGKSGADMGKMFMVFLLLIIGLALTPTVVTQVTTVTGTGVGNLTGAALAMAVLIPLFWVIFLIGYPVVQLYSMFKNL
jgi:hypothetical protein